MAKGVLIAAMDFSNVPADEFNDWYDTEHIPERQRGSGSVTSSYYQVSAFFERYRRDLLEMDDDKAHAEKEQVWHPEGFWAAFSGR
jgi:hypothetical protein